MASNKGYTTATKVRDAMAGRVVSYITDSMIDVCINRVEGEIDTLIAGTGVTWSTSKVPHWVIEEAATYGAAIMVMGVNGQSMNSLDELFAAMNMFASRYAAAMSLIDDEDKGMTIKNA